MEMALEMETLVMVDQETMDLVMVVLIITEPETEVEMMDLEVTDLEIMVLQTMDPEIMVLQIMDLEIIVLITHRIRNQEQLQLETLRIH